VKVRDDGVVKVLDFGLAKALDLTASSSAEAIYSPTLTAPAPGRPSRTARPRVLGYTRANFLELEESASAVRLHLCP